MDYSHKGTDQHILKTSETESAQKKTSEESVGINNTSSRFWPKSPWQTFTITQGYINFGEGAEF